MSNFQSQNQSERESSLNPSSLRILCLHDSESHANELSDKLEEFGERLYENHMIDLVYINSPLVMRGSNNNDDGENPNRIWWEEQEGNKCVGLDASLLLLRQIWASMPFWGILAVGAGAAVGSFLPLMPVSPMPAFCIFVNGKSLLKDETERLIDDFACLHIIGPNPGPSEKLVRQFGGKVYQAKNGFSKPTFNAIGKFLVSQKKKLRQSGGTVLALQNQLYLAEQEAAHAVARHIAESPPKALMAIISPENVGGFTGRKRRPEGGGAPCPSEFLLNREKRTTDPHGPTRQHPSQQSYSPAREDESVDCGSNGK